MASAAAALREALLVAVCVLLIHSSMGYKPPHPRVPASKHCPYTGQKLPPPPAPKLQPPPPVPSSPPPTPPPSPSSPPPVPTSSPPPPPPVPSPPPPPTLTAPAPAPAAINCTKDYCDKRCSTICQDSRDAATKRCGIDYGEKYFDNCYGSCTSSNCDSCAYSGCGFSHCPCDNANATMCCQRCHGQLNGMYQLCVSFAGRSEYYCRMGCQNSCYQHCTQLGA